MAITTYSELQTAVGRWLQRTDLATVIPDFIALAEAEFARRLRLTGQLTRLTISWDERWESLPADWLEVRSVTLNVGGGRLPLGYMAPDVATQYSTTGYPRFYTVVGTEIGLVPPPDGTYSGELVYWAKPSSLSGSVSSNYWLEVAPDLYLARSVYEGAVYVRDGMLAQQMKAEYEQRLAEVQARDASRQFGGTGLEIRSE